MVKLVNWIGYKTETARNRGVMIGVFVAQFFNTAILLILVNANIPDSGIPFYLFNREYSDFTGPWFSDIGSALT
jgi:hypothetical protein